MICCTLALLEVLSKYMNEMISEINDMLHISASGSDVEEYDKYDLLIWKVDFVPHLEEHKPITYN